ncbi:ATP-binding response regulator [Skermanella rosea]|uniref:ATP-binding response regulator n=1 Tax=Skermanella rosea TaxID=1817965 RepID=UPI001932BA0F|nr:ATP-binding protein [Skermanella rosea]
MAILREVQSRPAGPIPTLIVTARDALGDRVGGLDGGADDYIVKPFDLIELEARIRAVLRRPGTRPCTVLRCGSLEFDTSRREASVAGRVVELTRRESDLLGALVRAAGRIDPELEALAETLMEENGEPFAVLALSVAAALVLVWFVAGWSLRPLGRAAREAAAIVPGAPTARLSPAGLPAEIQPLVGAVNGALDRLAGAYEAEGRFTADAAHELRTPLAVLSVRLQRAEIGGTADWPAIRRDLSDLTRLVNQLLDLARKEAASRAEDPRTLPPVDLGRTVREAAAAVLPVAETAGRAIEVDAPPHAVPVRGRADDLRDAVRNLLDNALAHGGGAVTVRLTAGAEAVLEVADEGPGVPEHLREEFFDRFRKGRAASPGAGLGLAIVRHVVRAHGGDARFLPVDGGSRIEIRLPLGARS